MQGVGGVSGRREHYLPRQIFQVFNFARAGLTCRANYARQAKLPLQKVSLCPQDLIQSKNFWIYVITSDSCGVATFTVVCWSKDRRTWELRLQGCLLVSINTKPNCTLVCMHVEYQSSHCFFTSQSCHETCACAWRRSMGKQVYLCKTACCHPANFGRKGLDNWFTSSKSSRHGHEACLWAGQSHHGMQWYCAACVIGLLSWFVHEYCHGL